MQIVISNHRYWLSKIRSELEAVKREQQVFREILYEEEVRRVGFWRKFLPFLKEVSMEDIVEERYGITSQPRWRLANYRLHIEDLGRLLKLITMVKDGRVDKVTLSQEDLRLIEEYA